MNNRIVILGLDGVPYDLIKDFSNKGIMPNVRNIIKNGSFIKTITTIPEVSSVAWSSIITGANPGEHSVYGFTDIIEGTYTIKYHNIRWLKVNPFWYNDSYKHIILNVPATYPAQPLNGIIVTGFISPNLRRAVYPPNLYGQLVKLGYKVDIDPDRAKKSKKMLIEELFDILKIRTTLYRHLLEKNEWNIFMFVITGTDRLGHFMWLDHFSKRSEYYNAVLKYYKAIDYVIGEIYSKLKDEDLLVILSDHGMTDKIGNININRVLIDRGILKFKGSEELTNIDEDSMAFALDDGRIYIHYRGKYPRGKVPKNKGESVENKILEALDDVLVHGEKPFKRIYRKNELYHGPYIENAPDLVIEPKNGYNLLAGTDSEKLFEKDHLSGTHNLEPFLIIDKPLLDKNVRVYIYQIIHILGLNGG